MGGEDGSLSFLTCAEEFGAAGGWRSEAGGGRGSGGGGEHGANAGSGGAEVGGWFGRGIDFGWGRVGWADGDVGARDGNRNQGRSENDGAGVVWRKQHRQWQQQKQPRRLFCLEHLSGARAVSQVAFAPGGRLHAVAFGCLGAPGYRGGGGVALLSPDAAAAGGRVVRNVIVPPLWRGGADSVWAVAWDDDARRVAFGANRGAGAVALLDLNRLDCVVRGGAIAAASDVFALAFLPGRRSDLVLGTRSGLVTIADVRAGAGGGGGEILGDIVPSCARMPSLARFPSSMDHIRVLRGDVHVLAGDKTGGLCLLDLRKAAGGGPSGVGSSGGSGGSGGGHAWGAGATSGATAVRAAAAVRGPAVVQFLRASDAPYRGGRSQFALDAKETLVVAPWAAGEGAAGALGDRLEVLSLGTKGAQLASLPAPSARMIVAADAAAAEGAGPLSFWAASHSASTVYRIGLV
ncbi:unnamed protein product [Phaeothamnion confervicola]